MPAFLTQGPRPFRGRDARLLAALAAVLVLCGCGDGGEGGLFADDGAPGRAGVGPGDGYLLATVEDALARVAIDGSASELLASIGDVDLVGVPDVIDGLVVVGAGDNTVNGLDLATGEFLWETVLGERRFGATEVTATTCVPGLCLAGGENGVLMAVDPASGAMAWGLPLRPDGSLEDYLYLSTPVVVGDRVYVSTDDGGFADDVQPRLYVLGLYSGEVLGSVALDGPGGTPVFADDGTLLLRAGGVLSAFDPDTLQTRWRVEVGRSTDPGTGGNVVAVHVDGETTGDVNSSIVALDLATGAVLWLADGGSDQTLFPPIVAGSAVYGSRDNACELPNCHSGYPVALDAATGETLWQDYDTVRVRGAPTLVGNLLVYPDLVPVGTAPAGEPGMGAIDVRDGSVRWTRPELDFGVGGPVFVAANGLLRPPWAPPAR